MSRCVFSIGPSHPCLPGHFPDNPIVPGVVVLERVIEAVALDSGARVLGIQRSKFVKPLRPGRECTIEWRPQAAAVRFVCSDSDGVLARGILRVVDG